MLKQSEIKVSRGVIFQNYCYFSSTSLGSEEEQKITMIFVDKVGKEHHVKDEEYYNKLEEPTDDENLMLDFAFGLKET
ncbi:hypothetical protein TIFTF001_010690 [Ficus carica]|uniref:Uncharacterized protein n=1 Tax=Ficus carica TaxID=3494 RepID=A0AA87ZXE4_FICCA|nr:hypothetical protein TIFTF001_010690 [Ficus carica]